MEDEHPKSETLAVFVEGKLSRQETEVLFRHLDTCSECLSDITVANDLYNDEKRPVPATTARLWSPALRDADVRVFRSPGKV